MGRANSPNPIAVIMKKCYKCLILKDVSSFDKLSKSKDGLRFDCKECRRLYQLEKKEQISSYQKQYREKNKARLFEARKNYRENNKKVIALKKKEYAINNREKLRNKGRLYVEQNKEKISKYKSQYKTRRWRTDPFFRLKENLRNRLYSFLSGRDKSINTMNLLGCDLEQLKTHIQSKFYPHPETGEQMSWENYGRWHVDHIKPLAMFDSSNLEHQKIVMHYSNLQPLWAIDNLKKGSKFVE